MDVEVAEVKPDAVKLSVRAPSVPVIARVANVATPLASEVAVVVPPSVPPPVAITADTTTPGLLTDAPAASRSCTMGC
jgi:hypothetical protein